MIPAKSPKQRLKILEEVYRDEYSVSLVCKKHKISRTIFYKWAKKFNPSLSRKDTLQNLQDKKKRIRKYSGQASDKVVESVKNIATDDPSLSKYKISERLKKVLGEKEAVGVHGVYNILKRSGLNTPEKRKEWQRYISQAGQTLFVENRLEIIQKAEKLGVTVAQVCRDFGISRQTYYKWKKRWDDRETIDALRDKKPQYDRRHLRLDKEKEEAILSIVIEHPDFSKYKIAEELYRKFKQVVSPHGVYNVLLRKGLNQLESRFAYSSSQAPEVSISAGWTDRVRYVLEQFVPSLAPAPPPIFTPVFNFLKTFSLSSILFSATIYSLIWWFNNLIEQASIGLVFATMALIMGSIFFLYSFKYYATLALVLSFSQQEKGILGTRY